MSFQPKKIIYFYPSSLPKPPVQWDREFEDLVIEYESDFPTDEDYWSSIPKDTLVIIDDNWQKASNCEAVSNSFKVFSRHCKYSIIVVSQSFYEKGSYALVIRLVYFVNS